MLPMQFVFQFLEEKIRIVLSSYDSFNVCDSSDSLKVDIVRLTMRNFLIEHKHSQ